MSEDVNPQPGDDVIERFVVLGEQHSRRFRWTDKDACHPSAIYEVVERATPPAPDPRPVPRWNPYRGIPTMVGERLVWDEGFEAGRLAGLQAPPVDDEPVGWANRYRIGWSEPFTSEELARDDADLDSDPLEVGVALWRDRRPGVQTPAADAKWATFEQAIEDALKSGRWRGFDGPDGASKDEVIDDVAEALAELRGLGYPKEPFERLSAGVPPATPEPIGYVRVNEEGSFSTLRPIERDAAGGWVAQYGGQVCAVVPVPVPDPETERS